MVDLLLTHGAVPDQDKEERIPLLHRAAQGGWVDVIEKLCKSGTDVNLVTPAPEVFPTHYWGLSPTVRSPARGGTNTLFFAAESMAFEALAKLIQLGADVRAKDGAEKSFLHYLRGRDDATVMEVARLLLDAGVEVNGRISDGVTPLHLVAMWELVGTARLLLERGAECAAADANGDTPLHLAVRIGRHRVVPVLVQNGACLEAENEAGETPFDEACRLWAPDTVVRSTVEELKTVSGPPVVWST
jgi:ankyrin repeat protein